jgi:HAD superfamily hydrolase (TIGR01509 family)
VHAFPLYALTNSNPSHQAVWSQHFAEPLSIFTSTFVSSEIGHPERAAFDHVASMIGALPESILFFDDGPENVMGARDAGMQAVHVASTGRCGRHWLVSVRPSTGHPPPRDSPLTPVWW